MLPRRPVRARGHRGAHARDGALADAAALGRPRRRARPGRRRVRERRVPLAAPPRRRRGRDRLGHRPRAPTRGCPSGSVWPLLEVIDDCLRRALARTRWPRTSARAARAPPDRRARRFAGVRHLADLFDRYALHRPDMVARLGARRRQAVARGLRWQAELFRRLRARIAVPDPAERLDGACARLREDAALLPLPDRLSLFGLTRLPAGHLRVLGALAATRDVHLFTLHPSPVLWERLRNTLGADRPSRATIPPRTSPRTGCSPPGATTPARCSSSLATAAHADHHHPIADAAPARCSARLQSDVRADRRPPARRSPATTTPAAPRPADRSVEVHACHGRARQVEVLRDAILHLLAEDPALEPRDVIVMCPDIETFAPLIQATFGAGEIAAEDDDEATARRTVRPTCASGSPTVRCARPTRSSGSSPRLIELTAERVTASQVLDLVDREPVRRRFGLDDDDVARLEEWVADSGIRWGLDAAHRAPFKLERARRGHLARRARPAAARRRDDRGGPPPVRGRAPARRRRERRDPPRRPARGVRRPPRGPRSTPSARRRPSTGWTDALAAAADALTATTRARRLAAGRAPPRSSTTCVAEARVAGAERADRAAAAEVRALLAERLQGRPTRANFRTGHLTVCTLMPMRSVPHRVVCLLGMDDGVFPRRSPGDGDDLMVTDPHVGDRDPRTEDRQLLLDALLAATDRLIVTFAGNDERTNIARPPAVPIGELLDVDRCARSARRPGARRTASSSATRCSRSTRATSPRAPWPRPTPWSFDARRRWTGRGRSSATAPPCRRSSPRRSRPTARPRWRSTTSSASPSTPCAPSCASGSASRSATSARSRGRAAGRTGRARALGRRAAAARRRARRRRPRRVRPGRDRPRPAPPGAARLPVLDRIRPTVEEIAGHARRAFGSATAPESVDIRVVLPDGRPPDRHRGGRPRRRPADGHVLPRRRAPPDRRLGAAARAVRRAPRPRLLAP